MEPRQCQHTCGPLITHMKDTPETYTPCRALITRIRGRYCYVPAKIPLRIYAKHQYYTRVRVQKYVIIYISTQKYKYSVITDCDIILHNYYITKRLKSRLYKVQKIRTHELKERILRAGHDGRTLQLIHVLLEEGLILS